MTAGKKFKRIVRERMEREGVSYSEARRRELEARAAADLEAANALPASCPVEADVDADDD